MPLDLSPLPLIDAHCHSLLRDFGQLDEAAFLGHFSEATDSQQLLHHVPHSLFWHGAQRLLSSLHGCAPELAALLEARRKTAPAELITRLLSGQGYRAMLVDRAYPPHGLPLQELQALLPARLYEVVRIEAVAEELLPGTSGLRALQRAFGEALRHAIQAGAVALKSIIAYRAGLHIEAPSEAKARAAYKRELEAAEQSGKVRLQEAPLLAILLRQALEIAAEHGLPFQFHTGFGDQDLDLRLADPLHLRPILGDPSLASVPIVLLHAGYPYVRQAAYLASIYPQVYVDWSLAAPLLHLGLEPLLASLLELAPFSKLLFGSDAHGIPEHWLLAARWSKRALAQVLNRYVEHGWLSASQAYDAAHLMLWKNAAILFRLS